MLFPETNVPMIGNDAEVRAFQQDQSRKEFVRKT